LQKTSSTRRNVPHKIKPGSSILEHARYDLRIRGSKSAAKCKCIAALVWRMARICQGFPVLASGKSVLGAPRFDA